MPTTDIVRSYVPSKFDHSALHSDCGCLGCLGSKAMLANSSIADGMAESGDAFIAMASADALDLGSISAAGGGSTIESSLPAYSVDGTLTNPVDGDVYSFDLLAGETYTFSYRGLGPNGVADPLMVFYDETGAPIEFDDDGGVGINALYTYTPDADGTFYVQLTTAGTYYGFDLVDAGDYEFDVIVYPGFDDNPGDFSSIEIIDIGTTYSFFDGDENPEDPDFQWDNYAIYLEAGKYYSFELAAGADYRSDYLDLPAGEADTILALYGPDGSFITFNDDIAFPDDISSSIGFFAEESGYYILDAGAYNGTSGGYALDVNEVDLSTLDPVDAIRWFDADNVPFVDVDGVPTAYVYFGDSDQNFGETGDDGEPMVTQDWNDFEKQQIMKAFEEYERILGVEYVVTEDESEATFRLLKTESEQYGAYMYPQTPFYQSTGQAGIGVFNTLSGAWYFEETDPETGETFQPALLEGGFAYAVMLHEFGHAHGLAHPHDNGGGSPTLVGVNSSPDLGVYDLNQGVYTVMSYNDAYPTGPNGETPFTVAGIRSGWSGTLSAFDIAALQDRYGVTERNTGDNTYELADENAVGVFYETIWDSAGTDEIVYNGSKDAIIDLLAATLDYSPTGGGVVSLVDGVYGGYTIANGVVIENASGGSGDDTILGNEYANVLKGNDGDDTFVGRGGGDIIKGGRGFDTVSYVDAEEGVNANSLFGLIGDGERDWFFSIESIVGSQFDDTLSGSFGEIELYGLGGNDELIGTFRNDMLDGGEGDDTLYGGWGKDTLIDGAGNDYLSGGWGKDTYVFTSADGSVDTIADLDRRETIDLTEIDAIAGTEENDGFDWISSDAFSGTAGELRYERVGWRDYKIEGDTDGDGMADLTIMIENGHPLQAEILFG